MIHQDFISSYLRGTGIEIGAFESPIPGISPIYIDKSSKFAGKRCHADFQGDATSLPIFSSSLDYVASSHVLEHCANPVAALLEWQRVLRTGGYAYCVIPDRRYTFDRSRPVTDAGHIVSDYFARTDDSDPTHIEDFIYGIDWSEVQPNSDPSNHDADRKLHRDHYFERARKGEAIDIHFHVFEPGSFERLVTACDSHSDVPWELDLVRMEERFPDSVPNGFLAVLRKRNNPKRSVIEGAKRAFDRARNRSYPIRPDAISFDNE